MKWFRLYSELLHDPKVLRVPVRLRWRWIELMCIANEQDPRGILPPLDDIALILRISGQKGRYNLEGELLELVNLYGLLERDGETFRLHHWDEWQYQSDDSTKRVKKHRQAVSRNVSVTPPDTEAEQIQKQSRTETEAEQRDVPLLRLFERAFGRLLSPMEIEQVHALEEEHPAERIEYGIREASDLNKRSVRYIQRICERQANGDANGTDRGKSAASANTNGVAGGVHDMDNELADFAEQRRHRTT